MDAKTIKEKIMNGQLTEEELGKLLSFRTAQKGSFLKTILKGVNDGYTVPMMRKTIIESMLILTIIIGTVILSYNNKMDNTVTAALMSAILGYLFGKIR
jgi:hypothetical protein